MTTYAEQMLATAQEDLEAFERRHFTVGLDHGELSMPGRAGQDTDRLLDQHTHLKGRVKHWQARVTAERVRAAAPGRAAAKAKAYTDLDYRVTLADCTEVRHALTGEWYRIERRNKKTVRVDGFTDPLTHTEIAGAR